MTTSDNPEDQYSPEREAIVRKAGFMKASTNQNSLESLLLNFRTAVVQRVRNNSDGFPYKFTKMQAEFKKDILAWHQQQTTKDMLALVDEQLEAAKENLAYHEVKTKNQNLIREWSGTVFGIKLIYEAIQAREEQ